MGVEQITKSPSCRITYEGLKEEVRLLTEELGTGEILYPMIQLVLWYYQEGLLKDTDLPVCPECGTTNVAFSETHLTVRNELCERICRTISCQECGLFQSRVRKIED